MPFQSCFGKISLKCWWWLIFVPTWSSHWLPRDLVKKKIWKCPWVCFQMRLTFELADWVKQIELPSSTWVGPVQSIDELIRTKGRVSENSLSAWWFPLFEHGSPPALRLALWLNFYHGRLVLRHSNSDSPLVSWRFGNFSASTTVSQFPIISLCIYYWFCFSEELRLIQYFL